MQAAEVKGDEDGGQVAGLTDVKDIGAREARGRWSGAGELRGRNLSSEDEKGSVGACWKRNCERVT